MADRERALEIILRWADEPKGGTSYSIRITSLADDFAAVLEETREKALEEAAKAVEKLGSSTNDPEYGEFFADAILALKGKRS